MAQWEAATTGQANHPRQGRVVWDVVDGSGLYFSRLATAGPYVFLASTAVDSAGRLATEAAVKPPYHLSAPAHAVHQAQYIFDRYAQGLAEFGSSLDDLLQVEQFTPRKVYADGYIDTRSRFIERSRPTTALACTGPLTPEGAVIHTTGIAVIPDGGVKKRVHPASGDGDGLVTRWADFGDNFAEEGAFTEVISAGPYVFVTGDVALDWIAGDIEEAVKVPDWIWLGSEARNEADFLVTRLEAYLARVGASLSEVVHMTVFLTDAGDLFEVDRVWKRRFGEAPPARTVVPVRGLGVPRFDGTNLAHSQKGVRMEHLTRAIRPDFGADRELIDGGMEPLAHESTAVKAGSLLWISQQYAGGRQGRAPGDARAQVEDILGRIDEICRAGGTNVANLVRLRAFVTDAKDSYAIYASLKEWIRTDPPTVAVIAVPGPLFVPGASVAMDAVAYVPGRT